MMKAPRNNTAKTRLCFVGSMVGRNPGHITQQGQVLADLFAQTEYDVTSASPFLNRYRRLADIVTTLIRQRHQTDIMILEVYGGRSFVVEDITSWLAARFDHRIVLWLHGGTLPEFMTQYPRWTKRVLRRADLVVTPSEFLARAVARQGFEATIIPNVIDLSAYPCRLRQAVRPRLFWMRNLHYTWNPSMAIRVLARLRESLPDAELVMAGPDKGGRGEVEILARTMGLADSVRFAGFLDMEGKAREGSSADIYINTNRIDNTPVAVIEACAMGMPVVTTAVGGIPDLLTHGQTGILVPDDDDEAMARAVADLVRDPKLASRLSRNGRSLAKRFSWEQVRPQWEQLFAHLLGERSAEVRSSSSLNLHVTQATKSSEVVVQ